MQKYMRIEKEEYCERIRNLQAEMEKHDIDVFFCYGNEGVHRNLTYFANYWPAFEVGGLLVGRTGMPLVLNATESLEFAATNAFGIAQVRQCRQFDESDHPVINPGVKPQALKALIDEVSGGRPVRRLGLGDYAIIPHPLYSEILEALPPGAEVLNCDSIVERMRNHKSPAEIRLLEQACIVTEHAFERGLQKIHCGMTQYEMQGVFTAELFREGGEGPGFVMANFTGESTRCSIGRNRHIASRENELITIGFGCHYGGYCGTYSRPFMFGKMPSQLKNEISFMIDLHSELAENWLKPGVTTGEIVEKYNRFFAQRGYGNPPGAPCHGLGIMEDEEPYFQENGRIELVPGMTIAVDNYFRSSAYGFRFEDAVVIEENGARLFTRGNWRTIEL